MSMPSLVAATRVSGSISSRQNRKVGGTGRSRMPGRPGRRLVEVDRIGLAGGLGEEAQLAGFDHGARPAGIALPMNFLSIMSNSLSVNSAQAAL